MVAPLNQRNAHPRDESVTFEAEGHRYLIQGSSEGVISVTTLLGEFFPKFDPDAVIDKYYTRWQQNSYKKPECYNKTKDEIKEMWRADGDKAKEEGTRLHQAIEAYYNNDEEVEYDQSRKEWRQFQAFQEEHQLEAYRTEMILWSSKHKLGGMVDLIVQNEEDGSYTMYDWKRSKHGILQNKNSYWGRPGKSPLHKLKDTNYYKYSMQLNLYRELLERFYEFKVSNMFIVRFHPSSDTYEKVKVGRMEAETNALLEHRHDDLDGEEALVAGVLALNI